MSIKSRIVGVVLIIAIGFHAYLTSHYYDVNFAQETGSTFCNVNDTISCDAASVSSYSSLFGIPLALLGAMTNLILLAFLLISTFGWSDNSPKIRRYTFYLAGFTALVSIIMGGISAFALGTLCPFCFGAYICSFIVFELLRRELDSPILPHLAEDIQGLFQKQLWVLVSLVAIPVLALVLHKSMLSQYGLDNIDKLVDSTIADWRSQPRVEFDPMRASLDKGPKEGAKMVIVEFADFLCSHCQRAATSLKTFTKNHPDVRMLFFNFPLDGACNDVVKRSSGVSCRLAKAVHCAGRNEGWQLHYQIFDRQSDFQRLTTVADVDNKLKPLTDSLQVKWTEFSQCMESEDTQKAIERQAKIGEMARVLGTPSIYVNGQKLPNGQLLPVLKAARRNL